MSFIESAKNSILQEWIENPFTHLTLMDGVPNTSTDYSFELGYRHLLTLDVSNGVATNTNVINIPVSDEIYVTHIGLTDTINLGSGDIDLTIPLKKPIKVCRGTSFRLEIGKLQISMFENGSRLGFNVEPNSVGTFGFKFIDCFKAGRDFSGTLTVQDDGREIDRDANGWPSSLLPSQVIRWHVPTSFAGNYTLKWDGVGTLVVENGTNIVSVDANTLTFDANEQETIRIRWDSIGPVNARCFPTSLQAQFEVDGAIFIDWFVSSVRVANVLRFGDTFNVRGLPGDMTFDSRPLPTDASESVDFINYGMSIESMCELCNAADADLWFCMPVSWVDGSSNVSDSQPSWNNSSTTHPGGWTEQQSNQVARLIRDNLNPNLKVYLEHGNNVLSLEDENLTNYAFVSGSGSQLNVPVYSVAGSRVSTRSTRDFAYSYHAWRTVQIGKEFKKVLNDRVESVLTLESGDVEMHSRVYQFLVKENILQYIDSIAMNPTIGNSFGELIKTSDLLDHPMETVVLDVNDSQNFKTGTEVKLRFINNSTGKIIDRSFLNSVNWEGGLEEESARNLAESISSFRSGWIGISVKNRVIVTTPGYTTSVLAVPNGISSLSVLDSNVIFDVLYYGFKNYFNKVNNNNQLTAQKFQKPLHASTIGIRDEGGTSALASLRQDLIEDTDRAGIFAGLIGKWKEIADDFAPGIIVTDSRWGGLDTSDPKSTRQIMIEYDNFMPNVFYTVLGSVLGRDELEYGQSAIDSVFDGGGTVEVTHVNLLDQDQNEISATTRQPLPSGLGFSSEGKRINNVDLVFTPSSSEGVAYNLGYYTSGTGNTLVATSLLINPVKVENGVDITLPVNSVIIAG